MILLCLTPAASHLLAQKQDAPADPCRAAIASGKICQAATERALQLMRAGNLEAITVVQDVRSGSLIASAASYPEKLAVTTPLLPLSTVKLFVAAAWWDHELSQLDKSFASEQLLDKSLVSGNDESGRQIALALRKAIGTEGVLKDLKRYGFGSSHSLDDNTSDKDWVNSLSIGEERFVVTALQLSEFLRGGAISQAASLKLQSAMRAAVERGTAKSAGPILADTGWHLGGKTGTGPDANSHEAGPGSDGWFAGLIFDPEGKASYTVATFVRHGGLGGGNAARISAQLARFIIGADSRR